MESRVSCCRVADVICQHKCDGKIIPLKFRITDGDGEYQTYRVKAYKDLTHYGESIMPNGVSMKPSLMWKFECKIDVFNRERIIILSYSICDNKWKVSFT